MITASIPARYLTAFALLLLISGLAAAQVQQVYRYIDVDGRVVYSDKPPPPGAKDAQAKRIGGNSIWGEWFAGLIDDVRVYNRALTSAQIQSDMNVGVSP